MPKKKNTTLRLLVPVAGFLVMIGVGIAMSINSSNKPSSQRTTPTPTQTPVTQDTPADPALDPADSLQAATTPVNTPAVQGTPEPEFETADVGLTGLIARADPSAGSTFDALGSLDEFSQYEFEVAFTPYGAGMLSLKLTHQYETVEHLEHFELQSAMRGNATVSVNPRALEKALELVVPLGELDPTDPARVEAMQRAGAALTKIGLQGYIPNLSSVTTPDSAIALVSGAQGWVNQLIVPFAMIAVEIDGQRIDLSNLGGPGGGPKGVWSQDAPGRFLATIENEQREAVARIRRVFEIKPGSYELTLTQTVENLTASPLNVRWVQTGPIDPPKSESTYGGDKRRFRFGYLLDPQAQAGDPTVLPDKQLRHHHEYLGKKIEFTEPSGVVTKRYQTRDQLWPTTKSTKKNWRLVWAGLTDRYFAVAIHPVLGSDDELPPDHKVFGDITSIDRLVLNPAASNVQETTAVLDLKGPAITVASGRSAQTSMGIFAGPMSKPLIAAETGAEVLGLDRMIIYNFGSCTSFCTFGWLTHLLLEVLRFNHWVTADWALAIIILVIMVRTTLHPITRWSQIKMQRFGVQMQSMGPKQQKFKDDPRKLQQETAKLWKEEGISPAGFLGCLPMFLQSPVWIALYATLFFAAELRHEPALYGVFQTMSGGSWDFLRDLSAPDAALPLGPLAFTPPIIGNFTGVIDTINILPLLMGFVFYAHQKYLTPPTSATMTPEQKSQQKMIKMMSVVMFPLIMYPAPSGLAIYFVTNSTIAIFENRHIRSHMKKHGMLDPEKIKAAKANKKPGFMAKLQKVAEAQANAKAAAQNQGQGFGSGKKGRMVEAPKKTINRQYKKKK